MFISTLALKRSFPWGDYVWVPAAAGNAGLLHPMKQTKFSGADISKPANSDRMSDTSALWQALITSILRLATGS